MTSNQEVGERVGTDIRPAAVRLIRGSLSTSDFNSVYKVLLLSKILFQNGKGQTLSQMNYEVRISQSVSSHKKIIDRAVQGVMYGFSHISAHKDRINVVKICISNLSNHQNQ